jgi:3-deoxy-D-manno-octulosonic-acid transferase
MRAATISRLFNLALLPFYPLLGAYTLWRRYGQKKSPASFAGQWGSVPREVRDKLQQGGADSSVIWLHAVSVGEQMAARPLAQALKTEMPGCRIALSVTTDTGFQTAQSTLAAGDVDAIFYFPLDLPVAIKRSLRAVQPDVFMTVETELWPNFLHNARAQGVLCYLVNGRVSDNLAKRAVKTSWLWRWMVSNLNGMLMRGEYDAGRMREIVEKIGLPEAVSRIQTVGDVKLGGWQDDAANAALRTRWREILGVPQGELLWVCGSTHPGEEEMIGRAYKELAASFPHLKLLLAPRHIERVPEVEELLKGQGLTVRRRSGVQSGQQQVILLDTVGELSEIYAAGDVAFVGGSLIQRGGHNVLEPVLRGVPVLFGPYMANFRAHAELIEKASLGGGVPDEAGLVQQTRKWLEDDHRRMALPQQAQVALAEHQGAAARVAAVVAKELKSKVTN